MPCPKPQVFGFAGKHPARRWGLGWLIDRLLGPVLFVLGFFSWLVLVYVCGWVHVCARICEEARGQSQMPFQVSFAFSLIKIALKFLFYV